jgi:hypothetical protein
MTGGDEDFHLEVDKRWKGRKETSLGKESDNEKYELYMI